MIEKKDIEKLLSLFEEENEIRIYPETIEKKKETDEEIRKDIEEMVEKMKEAFANE